MKSIESGLCLSSSGHSSIKEKTISRTSSQSKLSFHHACQGRAFNFCHNFSEVYVFLNIFIAFLSEFHGFRHVAYWHRKFSRVFGVITTAPYRLKTGGPFYRPLWCCLSSSAQFSILGDWHPPEPCELFLVSFLLLFSNEFFPRISLANHIYLSFFLNRSIFCWNSTNLFNVFLMFISK